ncbi:hypothetical protein MSAN_00497100 [Mycena sanguinolenta]|uniref:Uncharacterized protein n=1 Tax=Mycena sanguinolenta TaxID=230812 RepID=A0A8H6Z5W9_9AGAR|nr:hypothetical protein MSAN_00497100 [Mycena sanguinolenta]
MARKKYVCLCSKCSNLSFINEAGQIQAGSLVAKTTRREYAERDSLNALMEETGLVEGDTQVLEQEDGGCHTTLELNVFQQALKPVTTLCITLAAWLNLHVGISRESSGIFLKALHVILATTLDLIFLTLRGAGFKIAAPTVEFPLDIRTVYHSGLEPDITRTPCCPTCFKPYTLENLPDTCDWKKSPRTHWPCGTELKKRVASRTKKTKNPKQSLFPAVYMLHSHLNLGFNSFYPDHRLRTIWRSHSSRSKLGSIHQSLMLCEMSMTVQLGEVSEIIF